MKKLIHHLRALFHLSLHYSKFEEIVWRHLKKYHASENFHSGIYENEKRILTVFTLKEGVDIHFHYRVVGGRLQYRSRAVDYFDPELTTDMFVLATHFNNLLRAGKVLVDPEHNYVDFLMESDYTTLILYPGEIGVDAGVHFRTTYDVHWAFHKLMTDREEPAIIIADLMRQKDEEKDRNNSVN